MKVEGLLIGAIGVFLGVAATIYWFMSHEIIGTVALILSFLLGAMMAIYLIVWARKHDVRLEDRKDAEIVEGAGPLGFFPPKSIWPLWVALAITVMFLGPVFGWWVTILGAAFGAWAIIGWTFEYYRGDYSH